MKAVPIKGDNLAPFPNPAFLYFSFIVMSFKNYLTKAGLFITVSLISANAQSLTDSSNWKPLFDGETLAGWKSNEETPNCFTVENETIKVSGGRSHLFYVGKNGDTSFTDFELKLEIKTLPSANSGVFFLTQFQEKGWPTIGYEAQINSTHKDPIKTGSIYAISNIYVAPDSEHKPGSKFTAKNGLNHVHQSAPNTDGKWFKYLIRVKGNTISTSVDGKLLITYTIPKTADTEGKSRPKKGTFALQGHDPKSTVFYRNIYVRDLSVK